MHTHQQITLDVIDFIGVAVMAAVAVAVAVAFYAIHVFTMLQNVTKSNNILETIFSTLSNTGIRAIRQNPIVEMHSICIRQPFTNIPNRTEIYIYFRRFVMQ